MTISLRADSSGTSGAIQVGGADKLIINGDGSMTTPVVTGLSSNLKLSATGTNSLVSVSADEIVLSSAAAAYQALRNVSLNISAASSGANGIDTGTLAINTWYSVWVVWNGSTVAGLLSRSSTAPTMPGGYTHKARVGWIRTDSTGNKYPLGFIQFGRNVQYRPAAGSNLVSLPIMDAGTPGNVDTPAYVPVALASYVPPTAASISVRARQFISGSPQGVILVAPNNSYGPFSSTTSGPPQVSAGGTYVDTTTTVSHLIESANIYWASQGSASNHISACGWEDNL